MKKVYVILGPTSSGKTSLAIKLCKNVGGEIVSFDSRQIYKELDVGTGKVPTKERSLKKHKNYWEFDGVKVWGYDLTSCDRFYSAFDYVNWALPKINDLLGQGKVVFLVGGTGFYLDFITGKTKPSQIKPDPKFRKKLEDLSLEKLQKKLISLNKDRFNKIDKKNPVRLIRAIEVEMAGPPSPTPLPYLKDVKFEYIGLTAPRNILFEGADLWLDTIWDDLVKETQSLIEKGYDKFRPLNGLVYKSAVLLLNGKILEEEARQRAKGNLHAYIRRQQTYFKKNDQIKWFDITDSNFSEMVKNHVESK